MTDMDKLVERFAALKNNPDDRDWPAIWHDCCVRMWLALSRPETETKLLAHLSTNFVALLQQREYFELAKLAIPELRQDDHGLDHLTDGQRKVTDATESQRQIIAEEVKEGQTIFDASLYTEQRRRALDAEMHMACVMVHYNGEGDRENKQAIVDWLEKRPRME